jgi:hypothetical protein
MLLAQLVLFSVPETRYSRFLELQEETVVEHHVT